MKSAFQLLRIILTHYHSDIARFLEVSGYMLWDSMTNVNEVH